MGKIPQVESGVRGNKGKTMSVNNHKKEHGVSKILRLEFKILVLSADRRLGLMK